MINRIGFRAGAACLAALSAGLSIAIISISKVLLVLGALIVLLRGEQQLAGKSALQDLWTPRLVLWVLLVFSLSLFWTSAPLSNALGAMGKYGKLLVIPAFLVMIRTPREAV